MKGLVEWFARNSVAANLLMAIILLGGATTLGGVKTEVFPEFSLDMVSVTVPYPGASPAEVEESICVKIEEEVHDLDGIDEILSSAAEGVGTVTITLERGADPRKLLDDVKTRVDAISTFPELAEEPIVQEVLLRRQVVYVAVSGDADEKTLVRIGERVRDDLADLPGLSQVELSGVRPYEISIELSEPDLQRLGLTFDEVANAVRRGSIDLSGGSVKTSGGEVLLSTKTQGYRAADFEAIPLRVLPDGSRVLLGDVATVVDGFADTDKSQRFNGKPAVMVKVFRVGDQNALDISAAVREYIEQARAWLPEGIELTPWIDQSIYLKSRLELLIRNGLQGLALVFLVLALFLRFRLAFWVSMGIPTAFLGTVWLFPTLGASINMLSLFAFILVLGIVVDDAIVVGESIHSEHQRGVPGVEGAIRGAAKVAVPVTYAVATTICAFVPLAILPGVMGKFFRIMPMVVIPALAFSWLESKLILPAHLSHSSRFLDRLAERPPFVWWLRFQDLFARGLLWVARVPYRRSLEWLLRWRYLAVALAGATMLVAAGVVGGGFLRFNFFQPIEGDIVAAYVTMPLGTSAETTAGAVARIERAALELRDELDAERPEGAPSVLQNILATVGEQPYREQQGVPDGSKEGAFDAAHLGEVAIELLPSEQRGIEASEIVRRWRKKVGAIPGAVELLFTSDVMSAGDAINVELSGDDIGELRAAAAELEAELATFEGVFDVANSFRGGKRELRLDVLPAAETLGIERADLARQVRQAFYGEEAQRVQRGKDEVKVMVRYPREDRRTLAGLEAMRIRTPAGGEVPFESVARVTAGRAEATIRRSDRHRTIRVTSDLDKSVATQNDVLAELRERVLPGILAHHPGVSYRFQGENKQQEEVLGAMRGYFLLALFGIYALMAIPFRSYLQPAIVMTAIPFGLIGAIVGHLLIGLDLSILSLMGIVALAGVVVNDSLVLVDFINGRRTEGVPILRAVREAGVARFRPVLLTSLTTFAGLTPLMLEKSVQAQFLIPMAVSLAFGVMGSTLITLVFVPASYLILDDLGRLLRRLLGIPARGASAAATPRPAGTAGAADA